MSDLISRAEAAEIFEAMLKTVTDQKIKIGISRLWQQIKDLPSADRPRGEWIESREQNILMAKRIEKGETWRVCSNCGTGFMIGAQYEGQKLYGERFHNFCPRCGADMRNGEDELTVTFELTTTEEQKQGLISTRRTCEVRINDSNMETNRN